LVCAVVITHLIYRSSVCQWGWSLLIVAESVG
jgi:hypothetical protein